MPQLLRVVGEEAHLAHNASDNTTQQKLSAKCTALGNKLQHLQENVASCQSMI
jgi:hypothetical protein